MNIINKSGLKNRDGIPYFEAQEITHLGWIKHGFLTRKGGVSSPPYDSLNVNYFPFTNNDDQPANVLKNKNRIAKAFDFDLNRLILIRQIHKDGILILREPPNAIPPFLEYDAIITNLPNTFLGIRTADCIPILLIDKGKGIIAAIHAGREGTALHISQKVLKRMRSEFECLSKDFLILMGPSIGSCCYEIDGKVFRPEWEPFSTFLGNGKWLIDLTRINIDQMQKEGLEEDQIFKIDLCTHCHRDLFFSYRRDGKTGMQISFIGMKG